MVFLVAFGYVTECNDTRARKRCDINEFYIFHSVQYATVVTM